MPLANQHPVRFAPKGLSDAYDSTEAFSGACRSLVNLVFDQGNPELVICRPGVGTALTTFASFTTPTFISVYIAIGSVVYGMIASGRNAGHDEPFAYDVNAAAFIAISGITSGNTPTSPATTGAWIPPSMTVVGKKIILAHTGFSGAAGVFFGVLDISTPGAPAWSSANLATNLLPTVPTVVANLNNRCYFACGNVAYYSDSLNPTVATSAGQSLTCGDPSMIYGMSGLPVSTTAAGVVQALLIFKEFQIWQVTGDSATSNLALNYLSLNVGTKAGRSVVQTPLGTYFMAVDGPYFVDAQGVVRPLTKDPAGEKEQDIQIPFIYAQQPTRVAAGYSGGVYRICVDTLLNSALTTSDYWFDTQKQRWNGPHTWPLDCMTQMGNYFIVSHRTTGAALYKSQLFPDSNTLYNDNGVAMSFNLLSSTFPKDGSMTEKQIVESTIELSSAGAAVAYQITLYDEQQTTLNSITLLVPARGAIWGAFNWATANWSSNLNIPHVYTVPWTGPIVFQKVALGVAGVASNNIAIGSFFARYQDTGYTNAQ